MRPTIVTALYDIGRDKWTNTPINQETYINRFKYLCKLENPVIIYTEFKYADIMNKIKLIMKRDLEIVYENLYDNRYVIDTIEDEHPEYIYLKNKKSDYVRRAISKYALDGHVAWVDCGLVRSRDELPENNIWEGDFRDCVNVWTQRQNDDFMDRHNMGDTFNFISMKQKGIDDSIVVAPAYMWYWLEEQNEINRKWCRDRDIITTEDVILTMTYKYMFNKNDFILRYGKPSLVDDLQTVTSPLFLR